MDFDTKRLKDYKGYEIHKAWKTDTFGNKIDKKIWYLVANEDDYIGEEYQSLEEAKKFIDSLQ